MNEIARAEARVAREKAELARSLRAVGRTGERMARRLGDEMKPALGAAIIVAGAAVAVGVTVALVRRGRRRDGWSGGQTPSALGTAAKTMGVWALRLLARRVAQEVLGRLSAPNEGTPESLPAAPANAARA